MEITSGPGVAWADYQFRKGSYDAEATQMRFAAEGNESTLFWADDGVVYAVVSTGADRGRLTQIAQAVYDQMEKKS